jgi:HK97 family phage portal protein
MKTTRKSGGRKRTSRKSAGAVSIDTIIRRLEALHETGSGVSVTPDTAMQAPTVQAIVTAVSRRIATLPIHVYEKTESNGRARKEPLPNHPVARLLRKPNDWQTATDFWADAASTLVRWGNFYAFKGRGQTGPVRRILPLHPSSMTVKQDDQTLELTYEVHQSRGDRRSYTIDQMFHVRGPARNFLVGDSPVTDVREAIALEIAAERMGASLFGNGAMPGIIFKVATGSAGFKTDEEAKRFIDDFTEAYSKRSRFRGMLVPKGIDLGAPIDIQNEKAQFLQTRQYQRTVIAGAFGVPPHLVGDLSRGTYNNVEQQSLDFTINVVLPYVRTLEAAMERDLLTDEDRRAGVVIRFNLEATLRGDFKSRQEGLNIQRQAGVINANEWREMEGMNPISDEDGGEEYWRQGPSGQSASTDDGKPESEPNVPEPANDDDEGNTNADAA